MMDFVTSGRRRSRLGAFLICLIFSLNILQIAVAVETDQEPDLAVQVEKEEDAGLEPVDGNDLPEDAGDKKSVNVNKNAGGGYCSRD